MTIKQKEVCHRSNVVNMAQYTFKEVFNTRLAYLIMRNLRHKKAFDRLLDMSDESIPFSSDACIAALDETLKQLSQTKSDVESIISELQTIRQNSASAC